MGSRSTPARSRGQSRAPIGNTPVPALWAICCSVCGCLGPLSRTRDDASLPSASWGFERVMVGGVSGWWCGTCRAVRDACRPPATRGDCQFGARPCPHLFCRYHLIWDVSRKASASFELSESCALDVADQHQEGMTLRSIGQVLGCTREGVRYIALSAFSKLHAVHGIAFEFSDADDEDEEVDPDA